MSPDGQFSAISPTVVQGCLVITLPPDLGDELANLRQVVLDGVSDSRVRAAVLDFSALQIMDCAEFAFVRSVVDMAELLGARVVVAGFRPGVAAYLVESDAEIAGLRIARDLEEALLLVGIVGAGRTP